MNVHNFLYRTIGVYLFGNPLEIFTCNNIGYRITSRNRFANVATFEEINRLSREILIKTKDIVQGLGFELVYADTDSVFLKKNSASLEDFEDVNRILAKEAGLPISLEHHYKFLVLLPLEADVKMEASKHYFGITQSNELIARGIEIRRHDTPNFIKEFQTELLYTLFDCRDSAEVLSYWRKKDSEKAEIFLKIEPYLTFLNVHQLERQGADIQSKVEQLEQLNQSMRDRDQMKDDAIA